MCHENRRRRAKTDLPTDSRGNRRRDPIRSVQRRRANPVDHGDLHQLPDQSGDGAEGNQSVGGGRYHLQEKGDRDVRERRSGRKDSGETACRF